MSFFNKNCPTIVDFLGHPVVGQGPGYPVQPQQPQQPQQPPQPLFTEEDVKQVSL